MSEGQRIKVTISPIGKPVVEAIGFNGIGCAAATASIEKALAADGGTNERTFKDEWMNEESAGQQETQSW